MCAFISSRLDYCNTLLYGVSDGLMRCLRSVQNAGARRLDHITPILRQLLWLLVRQRVAFKIAVLVFQRIWQTTVSLLPTSARADSDRPTQRCASNNSFGHQCFAAAGPRLWNTLSVHLRQCDSLGQFKRLMYTHLFGVWDRGAL